MINFIYIIKSHKMNLKANHILEAQGTGERVGASLSDEAIWEYYNQAGQPEHFEVPGHGGLYVREHENIGAEYGGREVDDIIAVTDDLRSFGINVLPTRAVHVEGHQFIVTKKVNGVVLTNALADHPSAELLAETESTWVLLSGYAAKCRNSHDSFGATDMGEAQQFMYGTVSGEARPRIHLVDFGESVDDYSNTRRYSDYLMHTANGIVEIEAIIGRQMPDAREALQNALKELDSSKLDNPEDIQKAQQRTEDINGILDSGIINQYWVL